MARITIEDCLEKISNRFILIHMAAKRALQLRRGEEPLIRVRNREIVTALREIAAGKVVLAKKPEEVIPTHPVKASLKEIPIEEFERPESAHRSVPTNDGMNERHMNA